MRPIHALAAAFVVVSFAVSGATAADRFTFAPPSGWREVPMFNAGMLLGQWSEPYPVSFAQNINITARKYTGTLSQFVTFVQYGSARAMPDLKFGSTASGKTCGSHPAMYFPSQTVMSGRQLVFEQVVSIWNGIGYVVTYARLTSQPILPEARQSLTSLCVRRVVARPAAKPTHAQPGIAVPSATPFPTPAALPAATPGGYYTPGPPGPTPAVATAAPTSVIATAAPTATP